MFHFYVSTRWKSNVSKDETLAFNVSFLVSMFHFLFTIPLSKKLSGREIKPQWERFKTSMGEKSNPNGRNTTETLKSKMKHRMPMFHLLKVLIINVLHYKNETWNKKRLKVNIMYARVRSAFNWVQCVLTSRQRVLSAPILYTQVSDLARTGWKPNGAHSPGQAKRHPGVPA